MTKITYPGTSVAMRVGDLVRKSAGSKLYQVTQVDADGPVRAVRLRGVSSGGSLWCYPANTLLQLVEAASE